MKSLLAVLPKHLSRAGLAALLCLPLLVQADVFSLMRKVTMDRLEFEIVVTDDSDRPLPGALLWYITRPVKPETGLRLDVADAQRMAGRYSRRAIFSIPAIFPVRFLSVPIWMGGTVIFAKPVIRMGAIPTCW